MLLNGLTHEGLESISFGYYCGLDLVGSPCLNGFELTRFLILNELDLLLGSNLQHRSYTCSKVWKASPHDESRIYWE